MTRRLDAAAVRDAPRIRALQERELRHELLLEAMLVRVREALAKGSREQLELVEEDLVTAIAAGPPPLPAGVHAISQEEDRLYEKARKYRVFIEEVARRVEFGGTKACLLARELLGWPREMRTPSEAPDGR